MEIIIGCKINKDKIKSETIIIAENIFLKELSSTMISYKINQIYKTLFKSKLIRNLNIK